MEKATNKDLAVILGPTATGKTRLAALLASEINGEVISADSRQVYRGMDIGTGKDWDDYIVQNRRIPCHLVDIAQPGEEYNVYAFQKDFYAAYEAVKKRGNFPVLCGGTGLYIESVLLGYRLRPVPENPSLRHNLKNLSQEELVVVLKSYGPLHNTTDITSRERTIRAIEIKQYEKENLQQANVPPRPDAVVFGMFFPRQEVRARITERLKSRLQNGMIEEIKKLLSQGLTPEQLTFYGLEYRYVTQYVTGGLTYDEMFAKLNTAIHQFSKRQMTWFRRMEKKGITIHWIDGHWSDSRKVDFCLQKLLGKNRKL